MEIYQVLLHSGNIKYFDSALQDKLDEIHSCFKEAPLNPNMNLGIEIMQELEKMRNKNRVYRIITGMQKIGE